MLAVVRRWVRHIPLFALLLLLPGAPTLAHLTPNSELVLDFASTDVGRLDRATESVIGSGPHFATSADSSGNASQELAAMELDAHPSSETRISEPHFGWRRRDSHPITIGDATRKAAAPRETAPSTPLADALRQLQGDRPS